MSKMEEVIEEMSGVPDPVLAEVLDFLKFLKAKASFLGDTYAASESSLRRDWLTPEEDSAWQNL